MLQLHHQVMLCIICTVHHVVSNCTMPMLECRCISQCTLDGGRQQLVLHNFVNICCQACLLQINVLEARNCSDSVAHAPYTIKEGEPVMFKQRHMRKTCVCMAAQNTMCCHWPSTIMQHSWWVYGNLTCSLGVQVTLLLFVLELQLCQLCVKFLSLVFRSA